MSALPQHLPLVVETRGVGGAQTVESVHYGSVAVVDAQGRLMASAGDAQALTFTRSTIKPFQALEFMEMGGASALGYSSEEIAMLCASHSGEHPHIALVDSMLQKAQCQEQHLQCGCHIPLRYSWFDKAPPLRAKFDQRHNNCSGKHAGFLAYCRLTDTSIDHYLDEGHPLQKAIRARLARAAGLEETRLVMGIDGCSAPNYALPLATLAKLYALLAQPDAAPEANASLRVLAQAMRDHSQVISGDKRSDYRFVQAGQGDWLAKVGAGAVQTMAVRSAGIGLAIKIAGGNLQALYCTTVAVLEQLGLLNQTARTILHDYIRPALVNSRKTMIGEWRALVNLQRH
jgi:L-asparaginase II